MQQQPHLSSRLDNYLEIDGLRFRDLDRDGQLSPYEDWRLSPEERARDLAARMTPEEKAGLMVIGSHYPGFSEFLPHKRNGQLLNEQDLWQDKNPMTGQDYPEPFLQTSGTEAAIHERHQRFFIARDNLDPREMAEWTNAVQEVAERSRLGIPAVFASNPRNHYALVPVFGSSDSAGIFSDFPSELGLAALGDAARVEEFSRIAASEWRAVGLHKVYGYMADIASEPRWSRFANTFGEDPQLAAACVRATVVGFQEGGVACTVKHFPGGGVREDGHDPHFSWGQSNEYPTEGALATYHLPPFAAAVDAGVSAIMPYYAKPLNTSADQLEPQRWVSENQQFEEVAFAYNKAIITDLLRGDLGHTGYVNSDSGVIDAMPWGVEDLSKPERFARAIAAGVDIFSDMADPSELVAAYEQGLVTDEQLTTACERLLREPFELGLFDSPYVDESAADAALRVTSHLAAAERAQRDSVTLLRNSDGVLPLDLDSNMKVFVYTTGRTKIELAAERVREQVEVLLPYATVVDTPEEADLAFVVARPEINLFEDDKEGVSLSVDPRDNGVDVDRVVEIEKAVPTVLALNVTNPWLLAELEPHAAALVATFEISPDQLLRSLAGVDGGPKGKLPFAFPRSAEVFENSGRDVPGAFCGEDYPYVDRDGVAYGFGHGLRLS
ncbi:beta-glucosidase-like glycosyl hydrolase [Corynebacterium uterequi]|uniref:beta-glucosidase n=1 Tax=Corynebacterium uterequi TaxID=1072256 RepID=A0A0G3HC10_9CORY|nr:glycoside hydrolase family 3 N-terminal domain-containing protein [Corynebacterium uterequi]AKK10225.1 beta-glucosidase-like glycosyl hydrolase [Corynebacterium uterequi]